MNEASRRRSRVRISRSVPLRGRVAFPPPSPEVVSVYDRSLRRAQLRASATTLLVAVLPLLALPLLGVLAPDLAALPVFGVPVSWLVLAVAVYPTIWLLARRHVTAAERVEVDYRELVTDRAAPTEGQGVPS